MDILTYKGVMITADGKGPDGKPVSKRSKFDDYSEALVPNTDCDILESKLGRDAESTMARMIHNLTGNPSGELVQKANYELYKVMDRLFAVSLYALSYKSEVAKGLPDNKLLGLEGLSESEIGSLHFEGCGAIHATLRNSRLIMLPEHFSENSWAQFYTEMLTYYEMEKNGINWVIDFSSLHEVPENFWANIMAYSYKLKVIGGRLFLCWVHEDILPPANTELMCEFLRLKKIGKYHFSTM